MKTFKGQITAVVRVGASTMGNPTYKLRIRVHERGLFQETVEYKTQNNAGFAYAITSGWAGKFGTFTINEAKTPRITDAKVESY